MSIPQCIILEITHSQSMIWYIILAQYSNEKFPFGNVVNMSHEGEFVVGIWYDIPVWPGSVGTWSPAAPGSPAPAAPPPPPPGDKYIPILVLLGSGIKRQNTKVIHQH